MNEKKMKFIDKIKSNKKIQYIVIAVLSILVIFIVFFNGKSKTTEEVSAEVNYVSNLETKLEKTLSQVDGAGKVSVVINVESGMETVLATKTVTTENSSGKHTETTPILVNGKTVVIKELNPEITGVLIVCEGAKSIAVLNKLQQATMSLLDININKIEILSMK